MKRLRKKAKIGVKKEARSMGKFKNVTIQPCKSQTCQQAVTRTDVLKV